jgi:hypothetical protein
MTRNVIVAFAAAAMLAGCNNSDHTIVAGSDGDNASNSAANANVALPPSIAASKIYRCADNRVVYVDWLSDNKSANVRTDKEGSPTQVVAPEPGKPMVAAGGYSVAGTAADASVKIAVPGHSAQSCKA